MPIGPPERSGVAAPWNDVTMRFLLPILALLLSIALAVLMARTEPSRASSVSIPLEDPDARLEVDRLRSASSNRVLRLLDETERERLRRATVRDLVQALLTGGPRERRVAGALLGASGHPDGARALAVAYERENDPRTIATLALAMAESRRREAVAALVRAIRERQGIAAYEACRALQEVFGVRLGLDVDAWERWLRASVALRD